MRRHFSDPTTELCRENDPTVTPVDPEPQGDANLQGDETEGDYIDPPEST
jgi:hypothetical protein